MYESTQEILGEMLEVVSKSSQLRTVLMVCGLMMRSRILTKTVSTHARQIGLKSAEDYHQIALGDNDYIL